MSSGSFLAVVPTHPDHMPPSIIGHISSLHRYPVKSMLGEQLAATLVTERGLAGDRTHAVTDGETGKVASAKRPQLWSKLLQCAARGLATDESAGAVRITLPGGTSVDSDDSQVNAILSRVLGRPVKLAACPPENAELERSRPEEVLARGQHATVTYDATPIGRASPPGTFFDFAPIHVITSATLDGISAAAAVDIEAVRYRPNIVIETSAAKPFAENEWIDRTIQIGETIRIRIIVATPRCAVPTLRHGDLATRPEALRTLMTANRVTIPGVGTLPCAGVYGQVLTGGTIRCGDAVCIVSV